LALVVRLLGPPPAAATTEHRAHAAGRPRWRPHPEVRRCHRLPLPASASRYLATWSQARSEDACASASACSGVFSPVSATVTALVRSCWTVWPTGDDPLVTGLDSTA